MNIKWIFDDGLMKSNAFIHSNGINYFRIFLSNSLPPYFVKSSIEIWNRIRYLHFNQFLFDVCFLLLFFLIDFNEWKMEKRILTNHFLFLFPSHSLSLY